jgi:hypothetical protein
VVEHVDASICASLPLKYSPSPPMPCMCTILSRRTSLEAGSTRQRKGEEERSNVRNSVWQFGTGNRKCR